MPALSASSPHRRKAENKIQSVILNVDDVLLDGTVGRFNGQQIVTDGIAREVVDHRLAVTHRNDIILNDCTILRNGHFHAARFAEVAERKNACGFVQIDTDIS